MLSCPNIIIANDHKIDSPTDIFKTFNSFFANVEKNWLLKWSLQVKLKVTKII